MPMENTSLIQKQERLFEEKLCDTLDSRNKLYKLRDLIGINIGLGENSTQGWKIGLIDLIYLGDRRMIVWELEKELVGKRRAGTSSCG